MKKIVLAVAVLMVMGGVGNMWAAELPTPQLYWRVVEFSGNVHRCTPVRGTETRYECRAVDEAASMAFSAESRKECGANDRAIVTHMHARINTSVGVTIGRGLLGSSQLTPFHDPPAPDDVTCEPAIGTCNGSFANLCVRDNLP